MNQPKQPGLIGAPLRRGRAAMVRLVFSYAGIAMPLIQGIVLVPLYLVQIPKELYGAWLGVGNLLAWIGLVDPGIGTIIEQRVALAHGKADEVELSSTIWHGLIVAAALGACALPAMAFGPFVREQLRIGSGNAGEFDAAWKVGVTSIAIGVASTAPAAVLGGLHLAGQNGTLSVLSLVIGILSTVGLLLGGQGLISIPAGMVARSAVNLLGGLWLVRRWAARARCKASRLSLSEAKGLLRLSGSMLLVRVASTAIERSDALLSGALISSSAAIQVTLTGRLYEMVRMVSDRFGTALQPGLAHLKGSGEQAKSRAIVMSLVSTVAFTAAAGCTAVLAVNRAFVAVWVGEENYGGLGLSALQGGQCLVGCVAVALAQAMTAGGLFRRVGAMNVVEAAVKIGGVMVLVPWLGVKAFPIAGLAVLALVSMPYLSRLVAAELGLGWAAFAGQLFKRYLPLAVLLSGAALVSNRVGEWLVAGGWLRVGLGGVGAAIVAGLAVVAVSGETRETLRILLARARRRQVA